MCLHPSARAAPPAANAPSPTPMTQVRLSSKYQVVIPQDVRRELDLTPGQLFEVFAFGGSLRVVAVRPLREAFGLLQDFAPAAARAAAEERPAGRASIRIVCGPQAYELRAAAMKLLDSCGWLEVLAATPLGEAYRPALDSLSELVVPTVCVLEVAQHLLEVAGDAAATEAVAMMSRARVEPLGLAYALDAARMGYACGLPFPDNVVMATAMRHRAELWTHDEHFRGVRGPIHFVEPSAPERGI